MAQVRSSAVIFKVGIDSVGLTDGRTTTAECRRSSDQEAERRRWTGAVAVGLGRVDCINPVWAGPIAWPERRKGAGGPERSSN